MLRFPAACNRFRVEKYRFPVYIKSMQIDEGGHTMEKQELAVQLKHTGCNCCQAVLCAFADESGMPESQLRQLGAGFGAGMGCMEATCGALVGAQMLLGLKKYSGKPVLADARMLHQTFVERCGASICKDLKGRDTGKVLCECDDCVRIAAGLIGGIIED